MSRSTKSGGIGVIGLIAISALVFVGFNSLINGRDPSGVNEEGPSKSESCAEGEAFVEAEFIGDRGSEHYVLDTFHFGDESGNYVEIGGFWERRDCLPMGATVDLWVSGGGTEAAGFGEKTCTIYENGHLVDWTRDGTGKWRTISCAHVVGSRG